ncbi:MAG: transporter substrate-binding domain-containing protein [Acidimicrobiia bacterium]|nr:transporter substrate-binding domain-containing protein [Acidimicrobiia bacterium]
MFRFTKILAVLFAVTLLAAACGSDDDDGGDTAADAGDASCDAADLALEEPGTLTVATGEPVFPPWMIDDNPANQQGFESALVYALAEELGVPEVAWTRTGFDEAIAPGEKAYDFNIQQYSITPDRDEVVDFSDGYYVVEQAIIGSPDNDIAGATSLGDLADAQLGAAIGTTSLDYIDMVIQPSSEASVFDDNAAAKAAFDASQVDGIVTDLPTAFFITAVEIPDASIIGVLPRTGDEPEELGMLFEDGSALVGCVNVALGSLRENGTIDALEDEWLNDGGSIPSLEQ